MSKSVEELGTEYREEADRVQQRIYELREALRHETSFGLQDKLRSRIITLESMLVDLRGSAHHLTHYYDKK